MHFRNFRLTAEGEGGGPVVLFIERHNRDRYSPDIRRLLARLGGSGYAIFRLERGDDRLAAELMEEWHGWTTSPIGRACHRAAAGLPERAGQAWLGALRRLLKVWFCAARPPRWRHLPSLIFIGNGPLTERGLRKIVQRHFAGRTVAVISHSAGGIVSSQIHAQPNIAALICFGYPFRQPGGPLEDHRVGHLAQVSKPFLIIQGERDPYGSPRAALTYGLSPMCEVFAADADHDYARFAPGEFERIEHKARAFLAAVML